MNKPELSLEMITKFIEYICYVESEIEEGPLYDAFRVLEMNLKFEKQRKENDNAKKGL